ncbi:MAG: mechanosensitive ion channel [Chromatiales bacterium]|nr:mechanosensitive ion channel [Chromatiales bacterium]
MQGYLHAEFWEVELLPWLMRVLVAVLIWLVGKWIAQRLGKFFKRMMERAGVEATLVRFLGNIVYTVMLVVVALAALDHLGVKTTSLLAIFGAAGLAVGLAMKDSLSNFASGVMLILFRPFKVGDFIEAAGTAGVVEGIGIFATQLRSGDNREIIVPNGRIYTGNIINFSAKPTRRIDLVFSIAYGDDIKLAKRLIEQVIKADTRILEEPAPAIMLGELAESSVDINVRPWVNTADYWPVRADLLENIKQTFDDNGISIPFPQRELHVYDKSEKLLD